MEQGCSHFLLPSLLDRFPLLPSRLELLVETFGGPQRIIHFAFNGDPELILLLSQFHFQVAFSP